MQELSLILYNVAQSRTKKTTINNTMLNTMFSSAVHSICKLLFAELFDIFLFVRSFSL